jgi:hypothetical protein
MTLHFTDGVSIDTSGPLRILLLEDGVYVVGQGMLIPVNTQQEAEDEIARLNESRKPVGEYIDFEEI